MIELQRKLLGDSVRNVAFAEALKKVIIPGETTVLDLGSGTGFLGFLASKFGAKHVTMLEVGDILKVSRLLAKRNGITDCTFLQKHSTLVRDIPLVDVLVSETLGNYALEENIIESLEDAKRFVKPGGSIIPGRIQQFVCPVIASRVYEDIDVWQRVGCNIRFDEVRDIAQNNMYVRSLVPADLLRASKTHALGKNQYVDAGGTATYVWDEVNFAKKNGSLRHATKDWALQSTCIVYGFALWWEAELVFGTTLSTSPFAPPTHWEQIFLPLLQPIECPDDSHLELVLASDTRWKTKVNLSWTVRKKGCDGRVMSEQKLDMKKGFLM